MADGGRTPQNLRGEDIGIISPYIAQVALLTRLLNTDASYQKRFKASLGDLGTMQLANIEVKTVDGFEGREKEVIVFSTVRNNVGGYIGFLADRRRLNVGVTRAKRGLFLVGNMNTLSNGWTNVRQGGQGKRTGKGAEAWRRYMEDLKERGLVVSLTGERLREALAGPLLPSLGVRSEEGDAAE